MTEWPECELAGPPVVFYFNAVFNGDVQSRHCDLSCVGHSVTRGICMRCLVPKLIAAVQAAGRYVPCVLEDESSQALAAALAAVAAAVKSPS